MFWRKLRAKLPCLLNSHEEFFHRALGGDSVVVGGGPLIRQRRFAVFTFMNVMIFAARPQDGSHGGTAAGVDLYRLHARRFYFCCKALSDAICGGISASRRRGR